MISQGNGPLSNSKTSPLIYTILQCFSEWMFAWEALGVLIQMLDPILTYQINYWIPVGLRMTTPMLTWVWCPQSCHHTHSWVSHCPRQSTLLLVLSQQIKTKQENPSPPPDQKRWLFLCHFANTYRKRWRNECIQHQVPGQNPCHQHFLRLKAIREEEKLKSVLTEINLTLVIITEPITDLKQNPETLRFCEYRQWVLFSLHTPCEGSWILLLWTQKGWAHSSQLCKLSARWGSHSHSLWCTCCEEASQTWVKGPGFWVSLWPTPL